MEITSPIGELPFEVTEVRIGRRGLRLDGAMGAWPTEVLIPWSDLPTLAGRGLRPALPYLTTVAAATVATRLAAARRR
jgi:hypothetical protein